MTTNNTEIKIVMKTCTMCKKDFERTKENFYTKKGKIQSGKCKKCQAKYNAKYAKPKKDYERNKEYYKNYFKEYQKINVKCPACNIVIKKAGVARHKKTQKHIRNIETPVTEQNDIEVICL
jgi:hypothetical protein